MPLPTKPRSNPLDMAPAAIDSELRAQLDTRAERRRQANKARRPKATYDLQPAVQDLVDAIADAESVSRSDVVALAILRLAADYREGLVDLGALKRPARSLKFAWKLDLPPAHAGGAR